MKINGTSYSLPKSADSFLKNYLERVKKYTEDKSIDIELYQDIEERITEKLDGLKKKATQKDIVDIVNSLGEPEEIFAYIESSEPSLLDSISKDTNSIFKEIKKGTVSIFKTGKKGLKKVKQEVEKEIKEDKKIEKAVKHAGEKVTKVVQKTAETIEKKHKEKKFGKVITSFFSTVFNLIKKVICLVARIGFFGALTFGFLMLSIFMLVIGPMSFVDFTIENQVLFAHLRNSTQWGLLAIFIGSITLTIGFFGAIFKQKLIPKFIGSLAFIAVAGGVFWTLISAYSGLNEYANEYTQSYEYSFKVEDNQDITLSNFTRLHKNNQGRNLNLELPPSETSITFKKSQDNTLTFTIDANIRASSQDKADNILKELNPVQVEKEDNTFTAIRDKGPMFSNPVPFSFLYFDVIISVPQNNKISIDEWYRDYIDNVGYCYNADIIYNSEQKSFECIEEKTDTNSQ